MSAGYSGTPLERKLGIKPGSTVAIIGAPDGFALDLPDGAGLVQGAADVVLFFTKDRAALEARLPELRAAIFPDGGLWICWPKKASKVPTDVTEDVVRSLGLAAKMVDNKVCAIDAIWSGLRIVTPPDRSWCMMSVMPRTLLPLLLAALVFAGTAHADGGVYVALGDSYSAGPGIPDYKGDVAGCAQSDHNYPSLVAAATRPATFIDATCSGAVTADMTKPQDTALIGPEAGLFGTHKPQFDFLGADDTLVTVGIGGNDAGLVDVAYTCVALGLVDHSGTPCKDHYTSGGVDQVAALIDAAAPKVAAVFAGIHQHAPKARVLAVGYPAVLPTDGRTCFPQLPMADGDIPFFNSLLQRIDAMIATQAAIHHVEYVDLYSASIGADVCQPIGSAGYTLIVPTSGTSIPAHPNALGMRIAGDAVLAQLQRPPLKSSAALKIRKVVRRPGALIVRGTVAAAFTGRIKVTVSLDGRRVRRSVVVRAGHWRLKVRRHGAHRKGKTVVAARTRSRDGLRAGHARRTLRPR